MLAGGETRRYDTVLSILPDAEAIAAAEAAIVGAARQPADPYPRPSYNFRPLRQGPPTSS